MQALRLSFHESLPLPSQSRRPRGLHSSPSTASFLAATAGERELLTELLALPVLVYCFFKERAGTVVVVKCRRREEVAAATMNFLVSLSLWSL